MNEHHYQRIDKGIKRRNGLPTQPSPPADLGTWVIPEGLDPEAILDQYLATSTAQVAKQYGLSRKALVKWLRQTCPSEWKEAQVIKAECRKDVANEGLEDASLTPDPLSLARARELLKSGQWDLERLDSVNYGVKQEVTHKAETPVLSITILNSEHTGVMSNEEQKD